MELFTSLHHLLWAVVLYYFKLVVKEVSLHDRVCIFSDKCITKDVPGWVDTFVVDNKDMSKTSSTKETWTVATFSISGVQFGKKW